MTETFDNNNVPLPHSNDIELEVVPDRMMTPDEILEREYGITEVAHTPSFGDASTIARFTKTATIFSGNMSIICSTLGTGVLSLPYSMHELGMIPGVTLIVVLAVICVWTMWMLQEVGTALCKEEQVKANTLSQDFNVSYTWVGAKVLPKSGVFLEFVLFMISVGAVIAFVVAFCDCLTSVMKFIIDGPESISSSSSNNNNNNNNNSTINGSNINSDEAFYKKMLKSRLFWSIVIYVIDAPLSYAKSLNAFRYFSFFILPCISYLIFILIYYTVKEGTNPVNYVPASIEGIKAIPIVTFVYTGHLNVKKQNNIRKTTICSSPF